MSRAHGPSTPPVYMTVHGPSARTSSAVYMASTRPRTRDVYTTVYGPCTRPCTRHVYGCVHVSTCLRVQGPCTRPCTGHLHGRKRPSTRPVRPCNVSCKRPCTGRIGSCTLQCTGRVHGRFRPCTLAVYIAVFGRLHSAYTAGRTRPLHGRVQGPSGMCIRQVGLPGRVHVPRRHATAVRGPLRHTVHVRGRLHGPLDEHVHGSV